MSSAISCGGTSAAIYSSVLGLIIGAIALSGGVGALILSASLEMNGMFGAAPRC